MADVVIAFRSGDEDYYAEEGTLIYDLRAGERQPCQGRIQDHPGHYNNRVWCAVELFVATSPFPKRSLASLVKLP